MTSMLSFQKVCNRLAQMRFVATPVLKAFLTLRESVVLQTMHFATAAICRA